MAAATAYAQLQTATQATELTRDASHLQGSFSTKAGMAQPLQQLKPLAKAALALGNTPTQRKHLSIVLRLNEFSLLPALAESLPG